MIEIRLGLLCPIAAVAAALSAGGCSHLHRRQYEQDISPLRAGLEALHPGMTLEAVDDRFPDRYRHEYTVRHNSAEYMCLRYSRITKSRGIDYYAVFRNGLLEKVLTPDDFFREHDWVLGTIASQPRWKKELSATIPPAPSPPSLNVLPAFILVAPLELLYLPKTHSEAAEDRRRWQVYDGTKIRPGTGVAELHDNFGPPDRVMACDGYELWLYGAGPLGVGEATRFRGLGLRVQSGSVVAVYSDVFLHPVA